MNPFVYYTSGAALALVATSALYFSESKADNKNDVSVPSFVPASTIGEDGKSFHIPIPKAALKSPKDASKVSFSDIKPESITASCIACHINNDIDLSPPALRTADGKKGPAYYAGGLMGTSFNKSSKAMEQPSPAVIEAGLEDQFLLGEAIFEGIYVADPHVPFGGLGPTYIKSSCISCHPGYGRARRTDRFKEEYGNGYLAFVHNPDGSPVKGYTKMLQLHAVAPFKPYAKDVTITWNQFTDKYDNKYPDGTPYNHGKKTEGTLIYPTADIVEPLIPLPKDYRVSLESTIGIYGTGLLDAIKDEDIIAEEKRQASIQGPVKGKAGEWIYEPYSGEKRLGKFDWHCGRATLGNGPGVNGLWNTTNLTREDRPELYMTQEWLDKQKEMGIDVSSLTEKQAVEVKQTDMEDFMVWHRGLAAPAARNLEDPEVQRGRKIFNDIGCASCHKPEWKTGEYPHMPAYANQIIRPYTDMLQHDMGEENRGIGLTYRTPPLWGRGLMIKTADHTDMFHDLRARDFEEAILWHFGESEFARERFRHLPVEDREALIKFIKAI
ncbi:MAG: di-heme oxidoredictase family protein [Akkermansia sp.]